VLEACDLILPNEAEALALTGRPDLAQALEDLTAHDLIAVIKRGPAGALASARGKTVVARGPVLEPADTVGAGDSFDAGFLARWLDGGDVAEALRLGIVCGALSTRAAGGTAAQPDRAGAQARLGEVRIEGERFDM
jgi:sugar/nucleoside kinase (ribokinase family)